MPPPSDAPAPSRAAERAPLGWVGPLMWISTGLAVSLSLLTMASAGLVLVPIFLPISVVILLLIEYRQPGAFLGLVGALIGVDIFAAWLAAAPPCEELLFERQSDGSFLQGCTTEENLVPLLIGALVATGLIAGLLWAQRARRARAAAKLETEAAA